MNIDLEMPASPQHIAEEASRLLQNDAFNEAYRSLIEDIEKQLFLTDLGAQEERERLYHLHRAAQMFVNNIASRVNHFMLNDESE
jgi:hypothetical protein